jgi:hypothetical protein
VRDRAVRAAAACSPLTGLPNRLVTRRNRALQRWHLWPPANTARRLLTHHVANPNKPINAVTTREGTFMSTDQPQSHPISRIWPGSAISSGPLFDICMAVNDSIRTPEGERAFRILAAAATRDILQAKGWNADVLRVSATVFPLHDRLELHCISLGRDGDGTRKPAAGPGMWHGHLVAIADRRWLLDPTLDQTDRAPPMVFEFPDQWLAGDWRSRRPAIDVPIADGWARYKAFPGRGGFKAAPDFRPSHRREIVKTVVSQLGAN